MLRYLPLHKGIEGMNDAQKMLTLHVLHQVMSEGQELKEKEISTVNNLYSHLSAKSKEEIMNHEPYKKTLKKIIILK